MWFDLRLQPVGIRKEGRVNGIWLVLTGVASVTGIHQLARLVRVYTIPNVFMIRIVI